MDHTIKQNVSDRRQKSKSEKSVHVSLEVKPHDTAHSQVKHSIAHSPIQPTASLSPWFNFILHSVLPHVWWHNSHIYCILMASVLWLTASHTIGGEDLGDTQLYTKALLSPSIMLLETSLFKIRVRSCCCFQCALFFFNVADDIKKLRATADDIIDWKEVCLQITLDDDVI